MLGTNTVHFDIDALSQYGLECVEVCLGRAGTFQMHRNRIYDEIERANRLKVPLSVHLPIELPERFTRDYLDAFFLEQDAVQRDIALEMLELNFRTLSKYDIEYFVVHFPGIVTVLEEESVFLSRLRKVLFKIDTLAKQYKVKLLLEYFGSNVNFYKPQMWMDEIAAFSNLGILVDTGHLYFASQIWGFDFMTVLKEFSKVAEAFHLWTTRGNGVYASSESYLNFKHIVPHIDQRVEEGWAFNTLEVLELISKLDKPIIIEAAPLYRGEKYYKAGIESLVKYFANC
ncbi:sugar phosphate isomerase/epimerase family protein [Fusibacter ferrireducens]|uniref:TIM barrel protein n=1 Tax=Fusibacter ferrireducens TaxID=2785058 RepID=A0ABR9ZTC3_9FIRM|nr:TIM barrel protein [Fusibacter ferrireducens]MBF4693211.1 TIM barrel protein [Fusibacter ferrireducens]